MNFQKVPSINFDVYQLPASQLLTLITEGDFDYPIGFHRLGNRFLFFNGILQKP